MRIEANGISFNIAIEGPEGAPWLIFSNSLATDLSMWDDQAAHFSKKFRVLRYDQRGHGKTDAPEGRYTFDLLIADLLGLMDALKIERAHYCGLSMGGATGMGVAQRHPERFARVVLCDNAFHSTPETAKAWEERIAVAKSGGMPALVDSTLARWFPAETLAANPPHITKIRQMILSTPVNGFIGCSAALADHDFRSGVGKVRLPVLLISGEKDGTNAASMRQIQKEMVSGTRYFEIPGGGHISNMDQPAMFTKAVDAFLG
jgi:3-oxoadipate enol-lactonase